MKNRFKRPIGLLVIAIAIIASIIPNTYPRPALADPGVLKWDRAYTPGSIVTKNDIASPCEVNRIAIGSDGKTFYAVDIPNADNSAGSNALYKSTDSGISWGDKIGQNLYQSMSPAEQANFRIWNLATAPDDVNFIAVVTNNAISNLPRNIWVSSNGGSQWHNTNFSGPHNINAIDISSNYASHDICIGTRDGNGNGNVWVLNGPDYLTWADQAFTGDIMSLEFSPSYQNDFAIALVYSNAKGTYVNVGFHDVNQSSTNWVASYGGSPPEITAGAASTSPNASQIITAGLELPSDFSGQSPSLRRYYICTDDAGVTGQAGIYRIDNTHLYNLMKATPTKRICTIAYHGTFASGKLLAGEVLGNTRAATVMTWFTDSPTTCPIPCWYPALKPATGAAGSDSCAGSGYGNAQVAWSPDGSIAYAGTASSAPLRPGPDWPTPYLTGQPLDESAFSLSRNNGETWNQLALIDTQISRFTDIAPAPNCSTLYLASVSDNVNCSGFDSVWRSQGSPLGNDWERVLCQLTTAQDCAIGQTDNAILGLAGNKPDGQIVFWAAVGTTKLMWSPDFGDYWTNINTRLAIQDMAPEDSKTLYLLSPDGWVQKFSYSGTGWVLEQNTLTELGAAYSIATAYTGITPDNHKGHVIVSGTGVGPYDVAYSIDGGNTFSHVPTSLPTQGNTLVVASSAYRSDGYILAINSGGMYACGIYSGTDEWETWWGGIAWPTPVTSLAISRNYSFYFCEPATWASATPYVRWSAALAGLDPTVSLGTADQPTRRFRICGGMELGDPITIWTIDQQPYNPPQGGVWNYTDTLAWNGPRPVAPISEAAVDCDPVSGRAGQIDLQWKPISLSRGYRIEIAKDEDFALKVADIGNIWGGKTSSLSPIPAPTTYAPYVPPDLDAPALVIPPSGGTVIDANGNTWNVPPLEANHTYYWKVTVQDVVTGDAITSPSSWREIFKVRPGLPVNAKYLGPQLLSPNNGCIGCSIKPASFSWSPFQGTTRYRFVLAKDPTMTEVITDTEVNTTAYEFSGILEPGIIYFWRVKALEPFPSDWSPTFCFQTQPNPVPQSTQNSPAVPAWTWAIIIICLLIDIALLTFILHRRLR
ncbi:MAG: hypothetical protein FJ008_00950 [Chloroflexi bacterium]|nr:hypothetical protein [Chloroflexota bacterium]MBM3174843.1 hypothetical protein [Chloroflexota bacterium]MBM4449316.1 hypothetical protein [Chloroflexota bacterium]